MKDYHIKSIDIIVQEKKIRRKIKKDIKTNLKLMFGYRLPRELLSKITKYISLPISEESNKKQFMLNNKHLSLNQIDILWKKISLKQIYEKL
jgi:hypothetical protein